MGRELVTGQFNTQGPVYVHSRVNNKNLFEFFDRTTYETAKTLTSKTGTRQKLVTLSNILTDEALDAQNRQLLFDRRMIIKKDRANVVAILVVYRRICPLLTTRSSFRCAFLCLSMKNYSRQINYSYTLLRLQRALALALSIKIQNCTGFPVQIQNYLNPFEYVVPEY